MTVIPDTLQKLLWPREVDALSTPEDFDSTAMAVR